MRIINPSLCLLSAAMLGSVGADRDCCYVWQGDEGIVQQLHISWTASSQTATCKIAGWGTDTKCSVETSVVDNAWLKANATVSFKEPNVFHFSFGMNNNECVFLDDDKVARFWDSYLFASFTYLTQKDVCPDGGVF
ncbi:hypothetical protein QWA68_011421 [Fusarium oxysporum]|nr:hypothetical protein QWA68_011421 [Fusarium oxysporum]